MKNKDLWLQLDSLCEIHQVDWQWIKGHSGHAENEECDHLAQEEARKYKLRLQPNRKQQKAEILHQRLRMLLVPL